MKFRRQVISYLSKYGHAVPVESLACPGVPDVNYCLGGLEGWIELKQGRDVLRPTQRLWIRNRLKSHGIVWLLYRGDDTCYLLDGETALLCTKPCDYLSKGSVLPLNLERLEQCLNSKTDID